MDKNDREYTNGEITVYWYPKLCIHATICYAELNEVFNPRKRPWVNMNGAPTKKIIDVVNRCPTKALEYKWNKDNGNEAIEKNELLIEAPKPLEIQIMKNGPIIITGKFKLTDKEGKEFKTYSITSICRCGESANLPFCDGMHRKTGFEG